MKSKSSNQSGGIIKFLIVVIVVGALCVLGFVYVGKIINQPKPATNLTPALNNQTPDSKGGPGYDLN